MSEELRQAAARRAEANLVDAVEDVFRSGDNNAAREPELAMSGAGPLSIPVSTVRAAQGLKEKSMMRMMGWRHLAFALHASAPWR